MSGNFILFLQEEKEVQLHSCKHLITFRVHIMTFCSDISAVAMKCGEHLQILILPAYSLFTSQIPQSIEKQFYINVKRITCAECKLQCPTCESFPFPSHSSPPCHLLRGGFCSTGNLVHFPNRMRVDLCLQIIISSLLAFLFLLPVYDSLRQKSIPSECR